MVGVPDPSVDVVVIVIRRPSSETDSPAGGHDLRNSRELTRRAAATALHAGDKELAASILDQAALREADLGTRMWARRDVAEATSLASSRDAQIVACLALARAGETARSQAMVTTFKQKYPADTLMQGYWLPSINAALELERAHPTAALRALDPRQRVQLAAPAPFEMGPLYPVFLRGESYLMNHEAQSAIE